MKQKIYGFIDLEKTRLKLDRRFHPIKNIDEVVELGVSRGDIMKLRFKNYSIKFMVDSVYWRDSSFFINLTKYEAIR